MSQYLDHNSFRTFIFISVIFQFHHNFMAIYRSQCISLGNVNISGYLLLIRHNKGHIFILGKSSHQSGRLALQHFQDPALFPSSSIAFFGNLYLYDITMKCIAAVTLRNKNIVFILIFCPYKSKPSAGSHKSSLHYHFFRQSDQSMSIDLYISLFQKVINNLMKFSSFLFWHSKKHSQFFDPHRPVFFILQKR